MLPGQFMTYDQDFKGHITEDDTMSTLFARYGREHVESQMRKLFGDRLKSAGGEGVLSLEGYLRVVGVRQPRQPQVTQAPPGPSVAAPATGTGK